MNRDSYPQERTFHELAGCLLHVHLTTYNTSRMLINECTAKSAVHGKKYYQEESN